MSRKFTEKQKTFPVSKAQVPLTRKMEYGRIIPMRAPQQEDTLDLGVYASIEDFIITPIN